MTGQPKDLSSGAHPTATFPNAHLAPVVGLSSGDSARGPPAATSRWSAPEVSAHKPLQQLQEAVAQEDWSRNYAEGKTKLEAQASWSAGPERCSMLQCLATLNRSSRILEVGSFCGAAALALAEAIPKDGQVVALELEPFFAEFGQVFRSRSQAGLKIKTMIGPALDSLKSLVEKVEQGSCDPFDFVVIDGDKASMKEYFDLVWKTPGFISKTAVVCLDTTPFKGQVPTRYVRFGQADKWETVSGEREITSLRAAVSDSSELTSHEFGGLLVVQRVQQQEP